MLKYSHFFAVSEIVSQLAAKGLSVRAKPGTLLALATDAGPSEQLHLKQLVSSEQEVGAEYGHVAGSTDYHFTLDDYRSAAITASTTPNLAGLYLHDLVQESKSIESADLMAAALNQAQNEAIPLIGELLAATQAKIGNTVDSYVVPVDVIRSSYASFWQSPALDALSGNYADTAPIEIAVRKLIPSSYSADGKAPELKLNSQILDGEIADFVSSLTPEFVNAVYGSYFDRDGHDWTYGTDALNIYTGDRNVILLTFLYACYFSALVEVPTGTAENESDYRDYMTGLKSELGRRINRLIALRGEDVKFGRLVKSFPAETINNLFGSDTRNAIVVNDDIYDQWLAKGGDVEILLGSYVTSRETDPAKLIEFGTAFKEAWANTSALLNEKTRSNLQAITRESLLVSAATLIANAPAERFAVDKSVLQKQLQSVMETIQNSMLSDLERCATRIVCRTFFPHLMTERILSEMEHQAKVNPNLKPREAAAMAGIVILAQFYAEQLLVE
jgi:hypothetical protein